MRKSAGQKNPSEWYKKTECWKEIQSELPSLTDPIPPEFSFSKRDGNIDASAPMIPIADGHSAADYERIERCMRISSAIWMEVAERGQRTGTIHWKTAGICRTLAQYAAGGWERKPSPKQAKYALEAAIAVERAGHVSAGLNVAAAEADQALGS